jgi:hypothetical protein
LPFLGQRASRLVNVGTETDCAQGKSDLRGALVPSKCETPTAWSRGSMQRELIANSSRTACQIRAPGGRAGGQCTLVRPCASFARRFRVSLHARGAWERRQRRLSAALRRAPPDGVLGHLKLTLCGHQKLTHPPGARRSWPREIDPPLTVGWTVTGRGVFAQGWFPWSSSPSFVTRC